MFLLCFVAPRFVPRQHTYLANHRHQHNETKQITQYAERLESDLEGLEWPEGTMTAQRLWIGRSEGAKVVFPLAGHEAGIEVFTTRPDTLMGVTYVVLAPEHPLVKALTTEGQRGAVDAYVREAAGKSDLDRSATGKDKGKTGVFTGASAVHPISGEPVPVWVADYVLWGYGTGAVMAVPAHDERDHAFAQVGFVCTIHHQTRRSSGDR